MSNCVNAPREVRRSLRRLSHRAIVKSVRTTTLIIAIFPQLGAMVYTGISQPFSRNLRDRFHSPKADFCIALNLNATTGSTLQMNSDA